MAHVDAKAITSLFYFERKNMYFSMYCSLVLRKKQSIDLIYITLHLNHLEQFWLLYRSSDYEYVAPWS